MAERDESPTAPMTDGLTRRRVLGLAGGTFWIGGNRGATRLDGVEDATVEQTATPRVGVPGTSHLSYPSDPFIIAQNGQQFTAPPEGGWGGWEPAESVEEGLRTLLGLHPDVLDFATLAGYRHNPEEGGFLRRELMYAKLTGRPCTAGWNPSLQLDDEQSMSLYGPVMEANDWTYPDGEAMSDPRGILLRKFDGETGTLTYSNEVGLPSLFAPGTLDLMVANTVRRFEQGFRGFYLDGVNLFVGLGLDYSVWAKAAFQDYLESLPDERLDELGIERPSAFDMQQYLREHDINPEDAGDRPYEDAVYREYLLHQHRTLNRLFESYRREVHARLPDGVSPGDVPIWGNQAFGSMTTPITPCIYASDSFDVINTEQPSPFYEHGYKILHSLARFDKPVMMETELTEPPSQGQLEYDPTRNYPSLQRHVVAEGYAMGGIPRISLTGRAPADYTINHWLRKDGTVPDVLQSFIDFVWAHKRFLHDVQLDNPVAVVLSVSDLLWRRYGRSHFDGGASVHSFLGTCQTLRESQIPYEVITFGHPQLWDDADQLERMAGYEAVVLPAPLCLTNDQLDALQGYLRNGGTVITSGTPPERTAFYEPRDDVTPVVEHENAVLLETDPGRRRYEDGSADGTLVQSLREAGVRSRTEADDPTIGVNRLLQPDASRLILHVLNYDYTPDSDAFAPKQEITLELPKPTFPVNVARFYSPQTTADLDPTETENGLEVRVPNLVEWGFVVLAPSVDDLQPAVSEADARQAVERARSAVAYRRELGRDDRPAFAVAETMLESAEVALTYQAYGQAESAALEAVDAAKVISTPGGPSAGDGNTDDGTTVETPGFTLSTAAIGGVALAAISWLLNRDEEPPS